MVILKNLKIYIFFYIYLFKQSRRQHVVKSYMLTMSIYLEINLKCFNTSLIFSLLSPQLFFIDPLLEHMHIMKESSLLGSPSLGQSRAPLTFRPGHVLCGQLFIRFKIVSFSTICRPLQRMELHSLKWHSRYIWAFLKPFSRFSFGGQSPSITNPSIDQGKTEGTTPKIDRHGQR